jgi:hypothetical protein
MNFAAGIAAYPLAQRVGWVLLHSLWQGALVGVAFGLPLILAGVCLMLGTPSFQAKARTIPTKQPSSKTNARKSSRRALKHSPLWRPRARQMNLTGAR